MGSIEIANGNTQGCIFSSSPEPKAQDELLWSLAVRRPSTPLNDFSSETPGPIFFKLHVEPSVGEGLKIYTNCHGPLIKMATIPISGKTLKLFSRTEKALRLNLSIEHWGLKVYQVFL